MRAAVIKEPREIAISDVAAPIPGAGEVLVALAGSGVCGSNLPVWEGRPWFGYPCEPGAPGHEGWGRVAAVGDDVIGMEVGQPVAALSYHAFAEFDVADASAVVPLPPALAGRWFPGEAVACAVNVIRRSDIRHGDHVAVVGIGFLGALLVQLAQHAGAHVTAIGRRDFALDLAIASGAEAAVRLGDATGAVQQARAVLGGSEYDRVIEAAGAQVSLDVSAALTRERGRLVIAGYHQDGPRQVDLQMWNWRGLDVVNAHERDPRVYIEGLREAVRLVASGGLNIDPLITHAFPLHEAAEAFREAVARPRGFLKAVVTCNG